MLLPISPSHLGRAATALAHKYIRVANPAEQTPSQHLSLFTMQAHSEFPARKHRISMQKL